MSGWLVILLVALGFACGLHAGVVLIGGWRRLRADLLRIDREYAAVRARLRAIDEAEGRP